MATTYTHMTEEVTTLTAADGFKLEAFCATPQRESLGGLVILQEIFGITDQLKNVVRSYARDGYDTIIPALYDRIAPHTVVPFSDPDKGRDMAYGMQLDKVLLDVDAATKHVRGPHGVSVLGFCWGWRYCHSCGGGNQIAWSYGTRLSTYLDRKPKCQLLFHFGRTDPNSPPETIDAVHKAFPAAEIYVYEAGHAFANDVRPAYVANAATAARERTLAFLRKHHERVD
jgi:carboxymethylenebutenolidase